LSNRVVAFEKGVRVTENVLCIVGACMLFALMIIGAGDVIGRYIFSRPLHGAIEYGQMLMAAVVFLFWASTQAQRGHIRVDYFVTHYSPRAQAITELLVSTLSLLLFGLIAWQAILLSVEDWQLHRVFALTGVSLTFIRLFAVLGAIVICLEFIIQILYLRPLLKKGKGN
jgi:TRAP-type C4-dicarboxylate transport system permease small subunit